jgi:hypothetical protein
MTPHGEALTTPARNFSIALIHYPVYDKHKDVVATAVTNLDNPKRKMALETLQTEVSLEGASADIERRTGRRPKVVVTGATGRPNSVTFAELKGIIAADPEQPFLLLLGTGWGLIEQVFDRSDLVLEPIRGAGDYNHLSVRSAASIMLDRLFGR